MVSVWVPAFPPIEATIGIKIAKATISCIVPSNIEITIEASIAVNKFIPRSKYVGHKVFKYDIVKGKHKIEVKSKTCTSCPKDHYVASVNGPKKIDPANNVYFFTRVSKDLRYVWIVGWITKDDFFEKSVFKNKNEKDEEGFVYRVSGYHIKIKDLEDPKTFIRKG